MRPPDPELDALAERLRTARQAYEYELSTIEDLLYEAEEKHAVKLARDVGIEVGTKLSVQRPIYWLGKRRDGLIVRVTSVGTGYGDEPFSIYAVVRTSNGKWGTRPIPLAPSWCLVEPETV